MKKKDDGKLAEGVRMAETLDTLGTKVDELSASVDSGDPSTSDSKTSTSASRMASRRVAEQFAEQRAYTEFAYARLEKAMTGRFALDLEARSTMTGRFDRLDEPSWIRSSPSSPCRDDEDSP